MYNTSNERDSSSLSNDVYNCEIHMKVENGIYKGFFFLSFISQVMF